jgi:hypothetical protein
VPDPSDIPSEILQQVEKVFQEIAVNTLGRHIGDIIVAYKVILISAFIALFVA